MKTLLVHNATAGRADHDRLALLAALEEAGYEPFYCSSKSDAFPDILDEPFEAIVVAGGDGTVRKVATRLKRRDTPLVILPLGTANNIARSLGIDPRAKAPPPASRLGSGAARLDLARARLGSEGPLAVIEGIGMGAIAATMDDKVGKGEEGHDKIVAARKVIARLIGKAEPFKASVTLDGRLIEGKFLFVEALLHRYSGPVLPLCPPADSGDGALDVVFLGEDRRDEMAAWVEAPENSDPPVRIERGRRVLMEWSEKPALRLDDKRLKLPSGAKSIEMLIDADPLQIHRHETPGNEKPRSKAQSRQPEVTR